MGHDLQADAAADALGGELRPCAPGGRISRASGADGGRLRSEQPNSHDRCSSGGEELPPRWIVRLARGRADVAGEALAGFGADGDAIQTYGAFGRIAGEMPRRVDRADRADAGTALALGADIADLAAQPGDLAHQPQQCAEWT